VLQYHFNRKTLSAMAGITWWNFYFSTLSRCYLKSPQVIEFLRHLKRHLPDKVLIIWDGLASHRSHLVRDFVRQQRGRLWLEFLPAYAPVLIRSSICGRIGNNSNYPSSAQATFAQLSIHAPRALKRMRQVIAFWQQAQLFPCKYIMRTSIIGHYVGDFIRTVVKVGRGDDVSEADKQSLKET
jgi:transposase